MIHPPDVVDKYVPDAELFGVGALAHRGLPPFTGGLCGDFSPHRTTMTQTKCCPIFAFWVVVVCLSNGSSRSHRALEGSSLPSCFCPFVFLLRRSTLALRLGGPGSWQRSEFYVLLRRYGRRSGQPSSSSLARRACVQLLPLSSSCIAAYGYSSSSSSSTGTP